jgi:hypothetical protein
LDKSLEIFLFLLPTLGPWRNLLVDTFEPPGAIFYLLTAKEVAAMKKFKGDYIQQIRNNLGQVFDAI